MIENNSSVFVVNEIIDRHSRHAANKTLKIHRRREINFNILQNDENSIDSSFDSLQIRVSIKRSLQDIIATINNQLSKKNALKTRNANRVLIYFRELISMFFHMFLDVLISLLFFHETSNALRNELLSE